MRKSEQATKTAALKDKLVLFLCKIKDIVIKNEIANLHFFASPRGLRTGDFGELVISVGFEVGFGDSRIYFPGKPAAVVAPPPPPLLMVKVVIGIAMGRPPRVLEGEIMVAYVGVAVLVRRRVQPRKEKKY